MDITVSGLIIATTETFKSQHPETGELQADFDLKLKLEITRSEYLELVRTRLSGATVRISISPQQGDLFEGSNSPPAEAAKE